MVCEVEYILNLSTMQETLTYKCKNEYKLCNARTFYMHTLSITFCIEINELYQLLNI